MKIKNIYLLAVCFFSINLIYAQKSGTAIYTVEVIENKSDQIQEMLLNDFPDLLDMVNELSFQLDFNENQSFYSLQSKLYSNQRMAKGASLLVRFSGNIYKHNNIICSDVKGSPLFKKDWLEIDYVDDWKITKETKRINDFVVFKATAIYKEGNNVKGYKTKEATAWFCPEIPFPHGPIIFGGLPGLIFELHIENAVYGLTSIEFKNVSIPEVNNEDVISMEEADKLTEEFLNNR
jgi:GLPGLI family protein